MRSIVMWSFACRSNNLRGMFAGWGLARGDRGVGLVCSIWSQLGWGLQLAFGFWCGDPPMMDFVRAWLSSWGSHERTCHYSLAHVRPAGARVWRNSRWLTRLAWLCFPVVDSGQAGAWPQQLTSGATSTIVINVDPASRFVWGGCFAGRVERLVSWGKPLNRRQLRPKMAREVSCREEAVGYDGLETPRNPN